MFGFASDAQSTSMLVALLARAYNSFEAFKLASRNREQRIQFDVVATQLIPLVSFVHPCHPGRPT
jgi:hypothetical protein